jgi:hypothetical protein
LNHFDFGTKNTQYNKAYAQACMHNNVAAPYDEFYFNENFCLPMFS